jgi:hypothetical protein
MQPWMNVPATPNMPVMKSTKAIIACNDKTLAELVGVFWKLLEGKTERVGLGTLDMFQTINLTDIVFKRAHVSNTNLDGAEINVYSDEQHLRKYADLVEQLIGSPRGHQYLDSDSQNADIDLIVSIGEYDQDFVDKLKRELRPLSGKN